MTNQTHLKSNWPFELQQKTRDTLYEIPLTPDNHIHLKHEQIGYAKISILDLIASKLILHDKQNENIYEFNSVDELIQAGWVVD